MRRTTLVMGALLVLPAVALGGFRVSSYKEDKKLGAPNWGASSGIDNKPETAWMVDPESENIGEWIELDVPKSEIDKISVVIGWDKDEGTFKDYGRVKAARVQIFDLSDGSESGTQVADETVTFEDKRGFQVIDLPNTKVGNDYKGGRVRFTITETYPGQDFPNLAVSEMLVHLSELDTSPTFTVPPDSEAAKHDGGMMIDGDAKTYWQAESGSTVTFKLLADGFGVSSLGLTAGPATAARPKTVEVSLNDNIVTQTLENKDGMQWIVLPAVSGYTGSAWGAVQVKVIDVYPAKDPNAPLAIAEADLRATTYEGL